MKRLLLLIPLILAACACTGKAGPNDSAPTKGTLCPPSQVSGNVVFYGPNDPCPTPKTAAPHFGGGIPDIRGCPPMTVTPDKLENSKCSSVFNNPAIPCEVRGNCSDVPTRYCSQDPTPPCNPDQPPDAGTGAVHTTPPPTTSPPRPAGKVDDCVYTTRPDSSPHKC